MPWGPLGCELAQVFARFGTRTIISHREPLFLPLEERDAAQMVSDGLARDGVEIHRNTDVTSVRVEGGRKVVELVIDGNVATTTVDQILTGIGRLPTVQGTFTIPMHDVDRAIADSEDDGFVKIHVREGTGQILGATVVARHAGEMINVISLAMVAGLGLEALDGVIHAYPTRGEAIRMAAGACMRDRPSRWQDWLARAWVRL